MTTTAIIFWLGIAIGAIGVFLVGYTLGMNDKTGLGENEGFKMPKPMTPPPPVPEKPTN